MKKMLTISMTVIAFILLFTGCDGKAPLSRGAWEGTNFKNMSTGISLKVPDDWTIYSDEELASLMNTTVGELSEGNTFSEAILKLQNIYDCMTASPDTGSNISVLYENLAFSGSTNMNETEYLDILKEGLPTQIGYTCEFSDYIDVEAGGNTYKELVVSIPDYNMEQYYLCKKHDNYMVNIIVTVMPEDNADTILSYLG